MYRFAAMMKTCLAITLVAAAWWISAASAVAAAKPRPPNVILILMDDMGWRDVGFTGNPFAETPHIDSLAKKGLVFRQAYASAPNCAPTRACLMSGQYTPRHGIYTVVDPRQPAGSPWHKLTAVNGDDRRNDPAHAATVEAVDQNVGRIMAALDRLKLTDDTILIFTSDNGGTPQFTAPLRGSKGELYEGGIRVPLVVCGPGLAKPGSICDEPVTSVDLYPTLLELAGVNRPVGQTLDGASLVPAFRGAATLKRPRLFWHFPCYVGRATPASAVREGDFKLIEFFEDGGHVELYNLRADPNEERNLAASQPAKARALAQTLRAWQKETHAAIPREANPAYDPQADRPRGGQGGRGGRK